MKFPVILILDWKKKNHFKIRLPVISFKKNKLFNRTENQSQHTAVHGLTDHYHVTSIYPRSEMALFYIHYRFCELSDGRWFDPQLHRDMRCENDDNRRLNSRE